MVENGEVMCAQQAARRPIWLVAEDIPPGEPAVGRTFVQKTVGRQSVSALRKDGDRRRAVLLEDLSGSVSRTDGRLRSPSASEGRRWKSYQNQLGRAFLSSSAGLHRWTDMRGSLDACFQASSHREEICTSPSKVVQQDAPSHVHASCRRGILQNP